MLKKDNKGYYVIDSLEKLSEWYKLTNETAEDKKKHKQEIEKQKDQKSQDKNLKNQSK